MDGVITVVDEDGATHSLGAPLASALFVSSAPEDRLTPQGPRINTC